MIFWVRTVVGFTLFLLWLLLLPVLALVVIVAWPLFLLALL